MTHAPLPRDRGRLDRRTALRLGAVGALAGSAALLASSPALAGPPVPEHGPGGHGRPAPVLRPGSPESVGLDPAPIRAALAALPGYEQEQASGYPLFPGSVALFGHRGRVVGTGVSGFARLWADATTQVPERERVPMRRTTIFDLASLSKLFTSIAAVQQIERGTIALADRVADHLPGFEVAGKQDVTIRQLLTHTSGFTSWIPLYSRYPDVAARRQAVIGTGLINPPGTAYLYSDLNMISMQLVLERVTGRTLDELVRVGITGPLGLRYTGYRPPARVRERTAATEFQRVPDRGLVWGEVHDENAWSLDGVAGHAGVFSTVDDLAVLAQTLINRGAYGPRRILTPEGVGLLVTDLNQAFPTHAHGVGFEIDQPAYMGRLSGPDTVGHTGFTGTTIVIDMATASFAILLTNRVHPSRDRGSIQAVRAAFASGLADARR